MCSNFSLRKTMVRLTRKAQEYTLELGKPLTVQDFTYTLRLSGASAAIVLVEGMYSHTIDHPLGKVRAYISQEIDRLRTKIPASEKEARALEQHQQDLDSFRQPSLQGFVSNVHAFLTIDRDCVHHFTPLYGAHQFSLDVGDAQEEVELPLELNITDHKKLFEQYITTFKDYADFANVSMGLDDHGTLRKDPGLPWRAIPMGPCVDFKPATIFVRVSGEATEEHKIDALETTLVLECMQHIHVVWQSEEKRFKLYTESQGEIPRLVEAKRKASLWDVKAYKSRKDQFKIQRHLEGVQALASTSANRCMSRALTKALRLERERGDAYFTQYQAVPCGEGDIIHTWFMSFDELISVKMKMYANGKNDDVTVSMVIKDQEAEFDVDDLEYPCIPLANVTRTFESHDNGVDASHEVFTEVLPKEFSTFPESATPPDSPEFSPSLTPEGAAFKAILDGSMSPLLLEGRAAGQDVPPLALESRPKRSKSPNSSQTAKESTKKSKTAIL
jgi:hypothetical protein